jgi:hypothetical protein
VAVTLPRPRAVVAEASTAAVVVEAAEAHTVAAEAVIGKHQASKSNGLRNNPQPVSFPERFQTKPTPN